jgi:hypothetical protein
MRTVKKYTKTKRVSKKTVKQRGGMFEGLKARLGIHMIPPPSPSRPERSVSGESFEQVNPLEEAHRMGKDNYDEIMRAENVMGPAPLYKTITNVDEKMGEARKISQRKVTESYGPDTWRQIQHHFPGTPISIPQETLESIAKIIPKEFWQKNLFNFKTKLERRLFINTIFVNEETVEIKQKFLRTPLTRDEIKDNVMISYATLLPFQKRGYSDEMVDRIVSRVTTRISKFLIFYNEIISKQLTQLAINYWENPRFGDKNYIRTKNYIIERFGERHWQNIQNAVKDAIRLK